MKSAAHNDAKGMTKAFTLVELLTVLAVISILGCLLLPAMARTRSKSSGPGCISNLRQMMIGWAMYKDENNDILLPNAPVGVTGGWVVNSGTESWSGVPANTNPVYCLSGLLAPYIGGHIETYRCPADVIPSANGQRLRSRSMNGQIGTTANLNPGWRLYLKGSDLTCPLPKDTFVFADESMYSLNDGELQLSLNTFAYADCPAAYHDGACGISFADGHAEIHKWMWAGTSSAGLRNVPYQFAVANNGSFWGSSAQDVDYTWLRQHAACNHP